MGIFSFLCLLGMAVYYLVMTYLPLDNTYPTKEFYVADYADVLVSASKDYFISKSEEVYERTSSKERGGFQIVVATYHVDSLSTAEEKYNKTDLFRKWKIGEKDMGLLFLYFYQTDAQGGNYLAKISTEIGYSLSIFLTAGAMGSIVDEAFSQEQDFTDAFQMQVAQAQAYAGVLSHVLPDAYDIQVTPFDRDRYVDYLSNYDGEAYYPSKPIDRISYFFSNYGTFGEKYSIPLILLGFLLVGDVVIVAKGGGGSSGGGGISRIFRKR